MGFVSEILGLIEKLGGDPVAANEVHPSGHGKLLVVRDGYKTVEVEGPARGKRQHVFDDLETFAKWLNRHVATGEERRACEILIDGDSVIASLEPRRHDGDVIACTLVPDPTFRAWKEACTRDEAEGPLSQREFYQLARAHGTALVHRDVVVGMLQRIDVTVSSEGGEHIDEAGLRRLIKSSRTTAASITVPPSFELNTRVLDGLDIGYDLEVFLTPEVCEGPRLGFTLECPGLEAVEREARRDVARLLEKTLLEDGFLVGLGSLDTESVPKTTP